MNLRNLLKKYTRGNSSRVWKTVLVSTVILSAILVTSDAHALILDAARTALQNDLTSAGFTNAQVVGIFFGFLEFILLAIPLGTGAMALANMNRGAEAWLPWFTSMGGALVFIAFITVISNQIYA